MSRMVRLNQLLRREVGNIILMGEVNDPRLKGVTITSADISKDLNVAHVRFSILEDNPNAIFQAKQGLMSARGRIRRLVGAKLDLRRTPELKFEYDNSIVSGMKMTQLLDELSSEREEIEEVEGEKEDGE